MAEKDSDELAMPSDALRVVRTGTDGGTRPEITTEWYAYCYLMVNPARFFGTRAEITTTEKGGTRNDQSYKNGTCPDIF